jgi:3-deoxy-D-manno-octulosonic-acid transferase
MSVGRARGTSDTGIGVTPAQSTRTKVALMAYGVVARAAGMVLGIAALLGVRRAEANERLVRYSTHWREPGRPVVWVHAASVGEVAVAALLLEPLSKLVPDCQFVLTCQTESGKLAGRRNGFDETRFLPLDSPSSIRRFLDRAAPVLFVGVETELWPRLLIDLARRGIPRVLVNARISAKSFARYQRVKILFEPGLAGLDRICARDEESLLRFVALGARPERARVCGDLKLDKAVREDSVDAGSRDMRVLLALSTHEGEERAVLEAYRTVREFDPDVRLVLIPRHPARCDAVEALAREFGVVVRWSARTAEAPWQVLLVDTTGVTQHYLARAAVCFVGGSFVDVGGHNLVEPAAAGIPFASGPYLDNVRHQADVLENSGALCVVRNAHELAALWRMWLEDPHAARATADRARAAFAAAAGALDRALDEIAMVLRSDARGSSS